MIEDRAYQARALTAARAAFAQKKRAVLLVGPTGMGKTTIAGMIAVGAVERRAQQRLASSPATGRVAVVMLAHRRELVAQATARFREFGLDVGFDGVNPLAPVQVMKPQLILARRKMPDADLVIVDEAHHYVADEWGQIVRAYLNAGARVVGLTATAERGDGLGLGGMFDHLVVVAQIGELTRLGFLVPAKTVHPSYDVRKMACEPWEAYLKWGEGRSNVVFAPHVKAAEDFAQGFRDHGIPAEVVEGETPDDKRDDILGRFASGKLPVVVNVMVLTEGWDCPRAKVCTMARRFASAALYLQAGGRVLRPVNGRTADGEYARIIDLAGNYELHGDIAEERLWSLVGTACRRRMAVDPDAVRLCKSCHNEIPPDMGQCPACLAPVPVLATPKGEGVELEEARREAERERRAALAEDKRVRMLATLYAKQIRRGKSKKGAEVAYSKMTARWPDNRVTAAAWRIANEEVARERGDAYEPPIVGEEKSNA